MKTFKEFLQESEKQSNLTYLQICELVLRRNFPEMEDFELRRTTKDEALRSKNIVFVKYYNEVEDDCFWYCSTPGEDGRNYFIPDDFVLDGYARSTRKQCINNGVDWIEVVEESA